MFVWIIFVLTASLLRYFQSTSRAVHRAAIDVDSADHYQPASARLSADPALNAFAQLGALRLQCDRAFISLIDDQDQHIIAETTRSISLYDEKIRDPGDELSLGEMPLDLFAGVCAGTLKVFTSQDGKDDVNTPNIFADSTRYVINDFTKESMFKDRPYVKGFPYMRYYAEVPLKTETGYILGSYCVVDSKPRNGLSEQGFLVLTEIASTIMRHLALVEVNDEHVLAEKLLDGLNTFVQGGHRPSESAPDSGSGASVNFVGQQTLRSLNGTSTDLNKLEVCTQSTSSRRPQSSNSGYSWSSVSTNEEDSLTTINPSSENAVPNDEGLPESVVLEKSELPANLAVDASSQRERDSDNSQNTEQAAPRDSGSIADEVCMTFQRASRVLREAMDLDGVTFLDASSRLSGSRSDLAIFHKPSWDAAGESSSLGHGPTESAASHLSSPRTTVAGHPFSPRQIPVRRRHGQEARVFSSPHFKFGDACDLSQFILIARTRSSDSSQSVPKGSRLQL